MKVSSTCHRPIGVGVSLSREVAVCERILQEAGPSRACTPTAPTSRASGRGVRRRQAMPRDAARHGGCRGSAPTLAWDTNRPGAVLDDKVRSVETNWGERPRTHRRSRPRPPAPRPPNWEDAASHPSPGWCPGAERNDCAICVLAMYLGVSYEDVLRRSRCRTGPTRAARAGLHEVQRLARAMGSAAQATAQVRHPDGLRPCSRCADLVPAPLRGDRGFPERGGDAVGGGRLLPRLPRAARVLLVGAEE